MPSKKPVPGSADHLARKTKNAVAQAGFRDRRKQYTATLEESLITLESSVLDFQQASRLLRAEVQDLQQENARLRLDIKTQDMAWRAFCLSGKPGSFRDNDGPIFPLSNSTGAPVGQSTFQYQEEQLNYRSTDSCLTVFGGHQDPRWPLQPIPATGADVTHQMSQVPPVSLEPPSLTSFSSQSFGAPEEQKDPFQSVHEGVLYLCFGNLCDTMGQSTDHRDFDYRPHLLPQGVTLHGGTADVSSLSGFPSDAVLYRLNSGEPEPGTEQQRSTPLVGTSTSHLGGSGENGSSSHHDLAGSDSKVLSVASRKRRRLDTETSSRSPSPSFPSLSNSVTVIKAQAFGALRRPRANKTNPESSAKVAMEALEAQGLRIGIKRPRMDNEKLSMGI